MKTFAHVSSLSCVSPEKKKKKYNSVNVNDHYEVSNMTDSVLSCDHL